MYTEVFIRQLGSRKYIGNLRLDEHAGYGMRPGDIFSAPGVFDHTLTDLNGDTRYQILSKEFLFLSPEKHQPYLQLEVKVATFKRVNV